jgi:hypothetical protein
MLLMDSPYRITLVRMECEGDNMFLSVFKLVCFFHINEYVLIKQENPIYITVAPIVT